MSDSNTEQLAKSYSDIAQMAVKLSLDQCRSSFEDFKKEIEKRANEVITHRPVMEIKFNDKPIKKLATRASSALPRLIINAKLGLYSMMVGPAGCGKTTAAHQLAEALGLQFGSVCLTAGASETWLFGRQTPTGFVEGSFSKIYREGGVFLADEMDAADANLLLSINTALSHSIMLNPMNGETIPKHKEFIFVGAANTNGKGSTHLYTGRSRLDAATLDRMVIIGVDYDEELEKDLCKHTGLRNSLKEIRANLKKSGFDEFISTRAFASCFKQHEAGVPTKEIMSSLIYNWGDAAKDVADKALMRHFKSDDNKEQKKYVEQLSIRFDELAGNSPYTASRIQNANGDIQFSVDGITWK